MFIFGAHVLFVRARLKLKHHFPSLDVPESCNVRILRGAILFEKLVKSDIYKFVVIVKLPG